MANVARDLHNHDVPGVLLSNSILEFVNGRCRKLYCAYLCNTALGFCYSRSCWATWLAWSSTWVFLLQPGSDAFSLWALLPVLGAAFYALAHITTRSKCQGVPLAAIALSQNLILLFAGLIVSAILIALQPHSETSNAYPYIFGLWSQVSVNDWLVLALLAVFAITIGVLLAGAYQAAPPTIVSTFEYSYLVFVAVWDILFFGNSPTAITITGMVLIVVAGLLTLHRIGPSEIR